jgi:hypothetical protein
VSRTDPTVATVLTYCKDDDTQEYSGHVLSNFMRPMAIAGVQEIRVTSYVGFGQSFTQQNKARREVDEPVRQSTEIDNALVAESNLSLTQFGERLGMRLQ